MELSEAINGRHSVRDYTTEPVDEETIRRLIADAIQAPSAIDEQPWTFTVIRDQVLLDRASREAKEHMRAVSPAGAQPSHFKSMLDDADFHIFYHAPVLVLISAATEGAWVVADCALAAQNLMLAGYAAGLGSCWIGFAQNYLNTPEGKAAFGLPIAWIPVAPIILGHPKSTTAPVPRRAPVIHWLG